MVHRSTGKRMGKFLADEIVGPLGIEFWMGLPEEFESRIAPVIPYPPDERARSSRIALAMMADPMGPTGRFMLAAAASIPTAARRALRRSARPPASPTGAASPASTRRWPMAAA